MKYIKFFFQLSALFMLVCATIFVGFYFTTFFKSSINSLLLLLVSILFFGSIFLIFFRLIVGFKIYKWIIFPIEYPWLIKGLPNQ